MNPDNSNPQGKSIKVRVIGIKLVRKLPGGESIKVRVIGVKLVRKLPGGESKKVRGSGRFEGSSYRNSTGWGKTKLISRNKYPMLSPHAAGGCLCIYIGIRVNVNILATGVATFVFTRNFPPNSPTKIFGTNRSDGLS